MRRARRLKLVFRRPLESLAALLAAATLPFLPRPLLRGLASALGSLAWIAGGRMRRVGLENLRVAFPALADAERAAILRRCHRHYALTVLDVFWFSRFTRSRCARWLRVDDSMAPLLGAEPQIWLTAHMGNWEVSGMAMAARGVKLLSVAAELENGFVDRLFIRIRQRTGQTIIPQQGAILKLARGLKGSAKWAILLDQNTKPRDGGVFVPFFGLPVPVSSAPAALALKLGVPVGCIFTIPEADGGYRLLCTGVIPVSRAEATPEAVLDLTRRLTGEVAAMVARHPDAWLWMYKRWKFMPPGADAAGFPPYARVLREQER